MVPIDESPGDLLRHGSVLLSTQIGYPVRLEQPQALESDNTVLRFVVVPALPGGETSVVLKQVTSLRFNQPGSSSESQRFLNEWASLEFLDQIATDQRYGPRLVASDRSHSFLILEDLGRRQTAQDLLLAEDAAMARRALIGMGELLGRMQAEAAGREDEFVAMQSRLGTQSPVSDSTVDQRSHSGVFEECLALLSITPSTGFWNSLNQVEALVHDSDVFRTFIHADSGPHNFLVSNDEVRLLDFEFGTFRHGFSDVVGARLGFPQTDRVHSVPEEDARQLENAYRHQIVNAIPQVTDDAVFNEALVAAAAHWALNRWSGRWLGYFKEAMIVRNETASSDLGTDGRIRTPLFTHFQAFVELANTTRLFLPVAETLHSFMDALEVRWPDIGVSPIYPALAE